jgi:hypothetical protein
MNYSEKLKEEEIRLAEIILELYAENRKYPAGQCLLEWWDQAPRGAQFKIGGSLVAEKK